MINSAPSTYKKHTINISEICMFIALFGSSIVGAQIGSISLNKIALFPLMLHMLHNGFSFHIRRKRGLILLLFYLSMVFSSAYNLAVDNVLKNKIGYQSTLFNNILQIIIFYIPLLLFSNSIKNERMIRCCFIKCFISVIRIHCVWAFLQEIIFFTLNISINDILFGSILGGFGLPHWSAYVLFDRMYLRASGFNVDPAFFGILLIIGFVLDEDNHWKWIYAILAVFTFSRTTILAFIIAEGFILVYMKRIKRNYAISFILCLSAVFGVFLYPKTRQIVQRVVSRFDFLFRDFSHWSVSSSNHILYYPNAIIVFIRSNIMNQLFGYGARADGLSFTLFDDVIRSLYLNEVRLSTVWCAESDIVGLLLGCGIVGIVLYYLMLFRFFRKSDERYKVLVVCIFTMGIMYNYFTVTFINLLFIFFELICNDKKNEILIPKTADLTAERG